MGPTTPQRTHHGYCDSGTGKGMKTDSFMSTYYNPESPEQGSLHFAPWRSISQCTSGNSSNDKLIMRNTSENSLLYFYALDITHGKRGIVILNFSCVSSTSLTARMKFVCVGTGERGKKSSLYLAEFGRKTVAAGRKCLTRIREREIVVALPLEDFFMNPIVLIKSCRSNLVTCMQRNPNKNRAHMAWPNYPKTGSRKFSIRKLNWELPRRCLIRSTTADRGGHEATRTLYRALEYVMKTHAAARDIKSSHPIHL